MSINRHFSELVRDCSKRAPQKRKALQRAMGNLQKIYPRFYFKQRVTEEFVHLADEAHHTSLYLQTELAKNPRGKKRRLQLQNKVRDLETSALVFAFRLLRGISDAEKLAASGVQG